MALISVTLGLILFSDAGIGLPSHKANGAMTLIFSAPLETIQVIQGFLPLDRGASRLSIITVYAQPTCYSICPSPLMGW
jgi:hypothetical protein